METLKKYMADLSPEQKRVFAERCGTTINYLRKVMSTGSVIGPEICVQIEIHSAGAVSRKSLNPDNWERIWPELRDVRGEV
ncbi:antirepressor protein Cro [Pluralibacter gergoviae]|nr:antirepressor protein Cro [Pluralibacter gergoviae]